MYSIAVILAGGSGTRMGLYMPKQFLELAGKTVLEHSVEAFHRNELIDAVIIVSNPDFIHEVETIVARHRKADEWTKLQAVIPGGQERSYSSVNALRHIADAMLLPAGVDPCDTCVIFHDAVRPLVTQRIITDVCNALHDYRAINVTLPVTDTVITAADGTMTATVDRSTLQRVQTPQGFRYDTIAAAYDLALADSGFRATDDCGVVLRYLPDEPIALVRGDERNLKLTFRDDIPLFEFLLSHATES